MAHPNAAIPHPTMMTLIPEEFEGNEGSDNGSGCIMHESVLLETTGSGF